MERITERDLGGYQRFLRLEERSAATIEKYSRDTGAFLRWLGGAELTKEATTGWKTELVRRGYAPVSVNAALSALNGFLRFLGREDCRVKFLRVQRRTFRDQSRELTRGEYKSLVDCARRGGKARLALLIETIGASGIRVSETPYITVEAAERGRAEVALKGKIRTILLPARLCRKLLQYAQERGITGGPVFVTRGGRPLGRRQIWAEMKALCVPAGVEPSKVFPHNLRHLFAVAFYKACRDIVKLADVLGHSSIETTRVYLMTTEREHLRQLDWLRLIF